MSNSPTNLLGLAPTALQDFFVELGEAPFRAKQILQWVHQRGISDFDAMTDISKALRDKLRDSCIIKAPKIVREQISNDGTIKWLLQLDDFNCVETVYIPEAKRATLCISSQVGCALNCTFCATATQGFNRNLTVAEIIGQLWQAKLKAPQPITNVVMMGMGEPLLNFDSVTDALALMRSDYAYALPRRRVTLSTSGVVPRILELAKTSDVALAVSLHAAMDELRNILVPINKKYPVKVLIDACKEYLYLNTGCDHITIEYVMLRDVNDSIACAKQLAKVLHGLACKVNLIPFNPYKGSKYTCSSSATILAFRKVLNDNKIFSFARKTRGDDIDAACGQLAGDFVDRTSRRAKCAK
ncbi:MAG: 23S rRNA (adenine(2503)-C(2))-methyltransferase RlmN [Legionellales bacterium]|nr:MAG: 23S rRNA (adenine(2503)-C(2))-methyltransferase RlmN [Legionellales bacterium]